LQEIRGERKSIGGKQNENKQFKTHTFELEKGSLVYLSTDGFADQNNLQRKKIGEESFKALLLKSAHQPLSEQASCLLQALAEHKQDLPQRDDILVIGFRL
jgi:serine phosphatase RsbU (regulator of sigma subunit)